MRPTRVVMLVVGMGACVSVGGEPPKPPSKLAGVRADYQKDVDKAKAVYDGLVKQAADDYKRKLAAMLDAETKAGNLDAAVLIREELKAVDAEVPNPKLAGRVALRKAVENTRWNWGGVAMTLQANGLVKHPEWDARKLVTRWEAIDRRTVVLVIDRGRDHDRYAVLEFSEGLDEFKGYGFENGHRLEARKRLP